MMVISLIIVVMVTMVIVMVMVTVPVMAVNNYQLMSDDRKKSSECSTGL